MFFNILIFLYIYINIYINIIIIISLIIRIATICFDRVRGPPGPLRTALPGTRIDPPGPGTRSPGYPEQVPDRQRIEERPIQIKMVEVSSALGVWSPRGPA
jgi:hypothetical protein